MNFMLPLLFVIEIFRQRNRSKNRVNLEINFGIFELSVFWDLLFFLSFRSKYLDNRIGANSNFWEKIRTHFKFLYSEFYHPPFLFFPFYFLLPIYGRESTVFRSKFRNGDFNGFTRFEVSWILNSHPYWLVCVSMSVISIT